MEFARDGRPSGWRAEVGRDHSRDRQARRRRERRNRSLQHCDLVRAMRGEEDQLAGLGEPGEVLANRD